MPRWPPRSRQRGRARAGADRRDRGARRGATGRHDRHGHRAAAARRDLAPARDCREPPGDRLRAGLGDRDRGRGVRRGRAGGRGPDPRHPAESDPAGAERGADPVRRQLHPGQRRRVLCRARRRRGAGRRRVVERRRASHGSCSWPSRRAGERGRRRARGPSCSACWTASACRTTRRATPLLSARDADLGARSPRSGRTCRLEASGEAVGLPAGQMGNSEVGHLNLGAGFRVLQDLPRVSAAIADGSFFENPVLVAATRQALEHGSRLHLLGLIGPGGVHAVDEHLVAMVELAARTGLPPDRVVLHAFTDGRDTRAALGRGVRSCARGADRRQGNGRHRDGPLLRHGPGRPLGPDRIGLGSDRARPRRTRRDARARRSSAPTGAARATSSSSRPWWPATAGWGTATRSCTSTSGPTAPASSPGRWPSTRFDAFDRGRCPAGLAVATLTEYQDAGRAAGGGRVPAGRDRFAGGAPLAARDAPAPRGRDREVRPRHLLLQRRRRGGVARRGAGAGAVAARRPDLRPGPGDERGADHRARSWPASAPADSTSSWSTTPTRTWSATPGSGMRRSGPRSSSTAAWLGSSRPPGQPGGALLITADHGNIEEMRDSGRRAADQAHHRAGAARARRRHAGRRARAARWHPGRRGADHLRPARHPGPTLDDRAQPDRVGARSGRPRPSDTLPGHESTCRRPGHPGRRPHRRDPAPAAWNRPWWRVRRRGDRLSQPAWHRADALPPDHRLAVLFVIFSLLNLLPDRLTRPTRRGSGGTPCYDRPPRRATREVACRGGGIGRRARFRT